MKNPHKRKLLITSFFDAFIIMVLTTYQLSLLGTYTIEKIYMGFPVNVFLVLIVAHLLRFGLKMDFVGKMGNKWILFVLLSIYLWDSVQSLFMNPLINTLRLIILILFVFLFFSYLYNVYQYNTKSCNDALWKFEMPMIVYSIYNIVAITIMFLLIMMGVSWRQNELQNIPLIEGHFEWGMSHYFPYYLSMAFAFHDLFEIPTLTGLSHEPHVIMWVITPFLIFYWQNRSNWKYLILLGFLFVLIETTSTTAILCFLLIIFLEISWTLHISKKFYYLLYTILVITMGISIFVYLLSDILSLVQEQILYKVGGGDDSGDTSKHMLIYVLSFGDIIGYGNFPVKYGLELKGMGAGLITTTLDVLLYIMLMFKACKCYLDKNKKYHYVGLGGIYFLLHGLKCSYMLFSYPYFIFIIFILILADSQRLLTIKNHV